MSSFRSEDMRLVQLFVQSDAAHETLVEIGRIGSVHFKDLNPGKSAFQRTFVNQIRECEEMERILRYIYEQVKETDVRIADHGLIEGADAHMKLDDLCTHLEEIEKELSQNVNYNENLIRQFAEVVELRQVLERCGKFFVSGPTAASFQHKDSARASLLEDGATSRLNFIAGLVPSEKLELFGRVLFRSTRGNMVLRSEHIEQKIRDPKSGELVSKAVFLIFFTGERIQQKVQRICDSFGCSRHPFPERSADQHTMMTEVQSRIHDLNTVLESTRDQRYGLLSRIALNLDAWFDLVRKNKAIYHTLNLFNYDVTHKCLIAEGWCPQDDLERVRGALRRAQETSGALVPTILNVIPTKETPPTFFRSNKFTRGFQTIIDAYGTARYQEYNPAVFSVITFPFLFGVMFGDAGHGLLMSLVAGYLVLNEKKIALLKLDEMSDTLFQGRYIVLLMGFFAFYCGCLYNEVFSVMNQAAPSQWEEPSRLSNDTQKILKDDVVYPFGVDPGWAHTNNKLNFYNSMKMKMSILMGVTQMVAGICCKLANAIHFKDTLTILFVWLPEMIFINSIFGYLCLAIIFKWTTNYNEMFILNNSEVVRIPNSGDASIALRSKLGEIIVKEGNSFLDAKLKDPTIFNTDTCFQNSACSLYKQTPPSLLDMLIKMFMSPGHVTVETQLYGGQGTVQLVLLLIAFASVPVLLLARPLILKSRHDKNPTVAHHIDEDEEEDEEHFDFAEVMIHQVIHTIEYVLGCISNTASYLRLWALSLAHAQLSEVFWERLVVGALEMQPTNAFFVFAAVTAWAAATIGVLMLMESLSAFLHALRLHWVEFMGKFYGADGYQFIPFDFNSLPKGAAGSEPSSA